MDVLMAVLPLVLTLVLVGTRLPGWVAPSVGTLTAVAVGLLYFSHPVAQLGEGLLGSAGTFVKILAIVFGGVLLARVMDRTGMQSRLAGWLSSGGGPTVASALLMVHGGVPFLESVTGFGVAVIIGMPLLLSFGFSVYRAGVLTLLGLTIGPWGSMAPGILLGSEIAHVGLKELGVVTALYYVPAFITSGIMAAVIAGRGRGRDHGWIGWAKRVGVGATSGAFVGLGILTANLTLGTPVAGATASLVTLLVWLLIIRKGNLRPTPGRALVPYLVLMGGTVLGNALGQLVVKDGVVHDVVSSPALWAVLGAGLGLWLTRTRHVGALMGDAGRMWLVVALPTAIYLLFGTMMGSGGLATVLADALKHLGTAYLFFAPLVAGLSGYITASGTGANAMFGATQVAAGKSIGESALTMMGLQNSAGNLTVVASPARLETAYRLGLPANLNAPPDPRGVKFTRWSMAKVLLPYALGFPVAWGVVAVLFL